MAIFETAGRIGATLIDMVRTRLELAAVDIEEETQRIIGYVVLALVALLLFGIALLLLALTVILLFWETHRVAAAAGMVAVFGVGAAIAAAKLKSSFTNRPRFMAATVDELNKDLNYFRNGPFE